MVMENYMKCITCKNLLKNEQDQQLFEEFTKVDNKPRDLEINKDLTRVQKPIMDIIKMVKNEGNCFPIIQQNESKIIFNISEINPEQPIGTCLTFNKSIYEKGSECIPKPKNTYYVINNSENTGVIRNCSEFCDFCFGENTTNNTNCIKCTNGYYKIEDSKTNCVSNNYIPINYYYIL